MLLFLCLILFNFFLCLFCYLLLFHVKKLNLFFFWHLSFIFSRWFLHIIAWCSWSRCDLARVKCLREPIQRSTSTVSSASASIRQSSSKRRSRQTFSRVFFFHLCPLFAFFPFVFSKLLDLLAHGWRWRRHIIIGVIFALNHVPTFLLVVVHGRAGSARVALAFPGQESQETVYHTEETIVTEI